MAENVSGAKWSLSHLQRLSCFLNSCYAGDSVHSLYKASTVRYDYRELAEHSERRAATEVPF